jgi:hypothetical protein
MKSTLQNFYRSPFSNWPPQYRKKSSSEFVTMQSVHLNLLLVVQFGTTLSTHISNFDDIGQCWIFVVLWWPFWKWWPVEIFQCQESIRDHIIYPHIKFWWYRTMLNFYRPFFKNERHNAAKIQVQNLSQCKVFI